MGKGRENKKRSRKAWGLLSNRGEIIREQNKAEGKKKVIRRRKWPQGGINPNN